MLPVSIAGATVHFEMSAEWTRQLSMSFTNFELAAGSPNTLSVPRAIRDYVSERGQDRRFKLESFNVQQNAQPRQVAADFRIIATGAEQLEPFAVRLTLGEQAARQLAEALNAALRKDERG
jgi:hypothetical protein